MNKDLKDHYKAQAKIIKALSHPTRLMFVNEIAKRERCVWDLTRLAGTKMPTVSRHLNVLKDAGILDDDKRGTQVFYHLRGRRIFEFFRCIESIQRNTR